MEMTCNQMWEHKWLMLFCLCLEMLSYHILVPVCPVLLLFLVLALQPLVHNCVPVDGCVINHSRTLPCHHDGRVILGISLNVLWLWAAGYRWETKRQVFRRKKSWLCGQFARNFGKPERVRLKLLTVVIIAEDQNKTSTETVHCVSAPCSWR